MIRRNIRPHPVAARPSWPPPAAPSLAHARPLSTEKPWRGVEETSPFSTYSVEKGLGDEVIPLSTREKVRRFRKRSTLSESMLWDAIRGRKLGVKFRRQYPVGVFTLDFYCHELKLAIEVDGEIHEKRKEYDRFRQGVIERGGIRFLRLSADMVVTDLNNCIGMIGNEIKNLTPNPSPRENRGEGCPSESEGGVRSSRPSQGASNMKAAILRTALLIASACALIAQVPQRINYQGKLVDTAGNVINGTMNFYFALYTNQTVGNKVWEETQNAVIVDRGYYSVQLGINGFSGVDFKSRPYFLAIRVTNTSGVASMAPELTPRISLLPVPVALAASNAAKADDSSKLEAKTFQQIMDMLVPVGTINAFFGDQNDATNSGGRWLICDGKTIGDASSGAYYAGAAYSNLYIQLYRNATGDTDTAQARDNWNAHRQLPLPDMRGRFLRGYTTDTTLDPDRLARTNKMVEGLAPSLVVSTLGSVQDESFKSHNHADGGHNHSSTGDGNAGTWGSTGTGVSPYHVLRIYTDNGYANIQPSGGNETRPKNMYVNYIIKY